MDMFIKFLAAAVMSGTPLIFGTLGEIITQKAGNLNLGVEGTMAIGAFAAFYVGYTTDSVILAVLGAFLAGMLCSLLYTFLTVTMRANQNVTGLTLTIFGVGLANFLGEYVRTRSDGATLKLSERFTTSLYAVNIPGLTDI
ncbi:MAG: ABC transporter permease, partial [Clostridiales bacterium]|nr:ABC transporter permease [Clostridiales bacterium]